MRGYISLIFGCHECSTNFQKMAVTIEEDVHSTDESILWLWGAHNRANKRLAGDLSEDPNHPKIQFPPPKLCRNCWIIEDGKEVPHKPSVLAYLKQHYSPAEFVQDAEVSEKAVTPIVHHRHRRDDFIRWKNRKTELSVSRARDKFEHKVYYQGTGYTNGTGIFWGFTIFDMSICVVFYMFCVLLLIYGYYHFMVRRGSSLKLLFFNFNSRPRSLGRSWKHPVWHFHVVMVMGY